MILANINLFEFSAAILDSTIGERTKWGSRRSPEGGPKGVEKGILAYGGYERQSKLSCPRLPKRQDSSIFLNEANNNKGKATLFTLLIVNSGFNLTRNSIYCLLLFIQNITPFLIG